MKKLLALAALTLLALTACGGDDGALGDVGTDATQALPHDSRTPAALAADQEVASRSVLLLSDFPVGEGWEARAHEDEADEELQRDLAACVGVPVEYFTGTAANAVSDDFYQGDDMVSSEVDILPTVDEAVEYMGIYRGPNTRDCFQTIFGASIRRALEDEVDVTDITVGNLTVVQHSDEVAGFRVSVSVVDGSNDGEIYLDNYAIRSGRAMAAFMSSTSYVPMSEAQADELISALAERLAAEAG